MAQVINTNMMSINAQRNLMKTNSQLATSIERLSSGMRINSAKDDAAGLAVAEGMTSDIRALNIAMRNANDGISVAQTAETALGEMTNNVQRVRELAMQAANETMDNTSRSHIQKEIVQISAEIGDIVSKTEFNGSKLFDGGSTFTINVGTKTGDQITMNLADMTTVATNIAAIDVSTGAAAADLAVDAVDAELDTIIGERATLGAIQNRFESKISNLSAYSENLLSARSRIMDTDFASETAELTRTQILQQAGTSMVAQANQAPQGIMSLLR
jgi:flagellin